jgi:hypothetical protein
MRFDDMNCFGEGCQIKRSRLQKSGKAEDFDRKSCWVPRKKQEKIKYPELMPLVTSTLGLQPLDRTM